MEPGLTLTAAIGADKDFPLTANGSDGKPATTLLGTDSLTAVVWAGADQAPVFAPSVAWDVAAPDFKVSIAAANTSAVGVGVYRIRVSATRSGRVTVILEAWLELTGSAGMATVPPKYGTAAGVREHLPFGDRYESASGLAGFARELGRAREWLDGIILKKCPRGQSAGLDPHSAALVNWDGSYLGRPRILKGYLDSNKLVLTPEVTGACERYAAHLVIKGVVAQTPNEGLKRQANELLVESHAMTAAINAEIDTNADGFGEWVIPLGITNTRYA